MLELPLMLSARGGPLVLIHRSVVETIAAWVELGPESREAGGILLGSYRGVNIEISACTVPMRSDARRHTLFDRQDRGHQAAALASWKASGGTDTYLGEWHTHPEDHPNPSHLDRRTWRRLGRRSTALVYAIGGRSRIWWGLGIDGHVVPMTTLRDA